RSQGLTYQVKLGITARPWQARHVRIVVIDLCAFAEERLEQLEAGRLARIIHVFLVGHAEESDLAPFDRLGALVERIGDFGNHERGHGGVDLARQLNETRGQAKTARDPGEIKRVDGYAVSPQARPRIE